MKSIKTILPLIVVFIWMVSACVPAPVAPAPPTRVRRPPLFPESTSVPESVMPTATSTTVPSPTTTVPTKPANQLTPISAGDWTPPETAATPYPQPGETFDGHEVVLRIHNADKLTGREDQLTRWSLWGAPAFTVTPDGSYWFVDVTNGDTRLVHLSSTGEVLHQFPANDVIYPMDIAATGERVWMLGEGKKQARQVISYELNSGDGWKALLPEKGYSVMSQPSLTGLALAEDGVLLLERLGGVEYVRMEPSGEEFALLPAPALTAFGHTYQVSKPDSSGRSREVLVDDTAVGIEGDENELLWVSIIGAAPDGSFYLLVGSGDTEHVRQYSLEGELLGMTRIPKEHHFPTRTDIFFGEQAVGTDGQLYAVVSTEDQDILIVRIELSEELPPLPTPAPYVQPAPMGQLTPAWETPPAGASKEDIARETLIRFLSLLDQREYLQAAELYGGGMEGFEKFRAEHPEFYEQMASLEEDPEQFWQSACSLLLACYLAGNIVSQEQISETEYEFWVELVWEDGYRYTSNGCCAPNNAQRPPVWQFRFSVVVMDGKALVMLPPPVLE
ncbi:MAG: hypothetical protein EHM41_05495 [Chloroflexi bacterium]|nr:MAG: hypothetical protein EHM41_05495 [Chloroflexota bacterium]